MLPDRVSLAYESVALPIALRGPAGTVSISPYFIMVKIIYFVVVSVLVVLKTVLFLSQCQRGWPELPISLLDPNRHNTGSAMFASSVYTYTLLPNGLIL